MYLYIVYVCLSIYCSLSILDNFKTLGPSSMEVALLVRLVVVALPLPPPSSPLSSDLSRSSEPQPRPSSEVSPLASAAQASPALAASPLAASPAAMEARKDVADNHLLLNEKNKTPSWVWSCTCHIRVSSPLLMSDRSTGSALAHVERMHTQWHEMCHSSNKCAGIMHQGTQTPASESLWSAAGAVRLLVAWVMAGRNANDKAGIITEAFIAACSKNHM